jgi:FkbM family methyltransferase
MTRHSILGAPALTPLVGKLAFSGLDIGARRGFTRDLLPIAPLLDAVGFEADEAECKKLNNQAVTVPSPWRSERFLPIAVGPAEGDATLHLYRQRGCSSILEADSRIGETFGRGDYYVLEEKASVHLQPLDVAARKHGFTNAAYMKIDVQGYELEVFRGAAALLDGTLVAIRSEVSFLPVYKDQPLFGDIAAHLRQFGFAPMDFVELHSWRRSTRAKYPNRAAGPLPYSKGQLVHGDVVFMKQPEAMPDSTDADVARLANAAMIALAYDFVDHAQAFLGRKTTAEYLRDRFGVDPGTALSQVSHHVGRKVRGANLFRLQQQARSAIKGLLSR